MYHLSYSDVNKASIHTFWNIFNSSPPRGYLLFPVLSKAKREGAADAAPSRSLLFSCLTQPMACP